MASSSSSSPEVPPAGPVPMSSLTRYSYEGVSKAEVLEDLSSRFILNLPDEELNQVERVSFQVEQAHWFYEDFIREQNDKLPSLSLKAFSRELFIACPLLHPWRDNHEQAFEQFMAYKTRVPVCGAIMLNSTLDKCVLVKGYKSGSGWGFPKGKINEGEPRPACAAREVLEETGHNLAGLIEPEHVIEVTIKEQKISLFIVPNVPEDTVFETRTRKEISDIAWFKLADLPTWKRNKTVAGKFYLISPFIAPLKKFIYEYKAVQKNRNKQKGKKGPAPAPGSTVVPSEAPPGPGQAVPPKSQEVAAEGSLDPHLARLLTNLAQSSFTSPSSKAEPPPSTAPAPTTPASATPAPATPAPAPATSVPTKPKENLRPAKPQVSNRAPRTTGESAALQASSPRLNNETSARATAAQSPQPLPNDVGEAVDATHHGSNAGEHVSETPTSPLHSARRSSTADISPYLSKATAVPSSAKRLQQLSLLESVADESARMAPIIAARAAMASRGPAPNSYPQPSPSVPPQPMASQYGMHMSGNFQGQGYKFPNQYANAMLEHEQYQLRSRTSQAMHRGPIHNPTGSVNIKPNQLLNTLSTSRGIPMDAGFPPLHQPRPMMDPSQFHLPSPHMIPQPPPSTVPNSLNFANPHAQAHHAHGVNHMMNGIPMAVIPPHNIPHNPHNPSTASLLSILNGKANHMGSFPPANGPR